MEYEALIDSGAEASLMSLNTWNKLKHAGYPFYELPLVSCVITSVIGKASKRLRSQVFIEFVIGHNSYEHVFLISDQVTIPLLLGSDFLNSSELIINFQDNCLQRTEHNELINYQFIRRKDGKRRDEETKSGPNNETTERFTVWPVQTDPNTIDLEPVFSTCHAEDNIICSSDGDIHNIKTTTPTIAEQSPSPISKCDVIGFNCPHPDVSNGNDQSIHEPIGLNAYQASSRYIDSKEPAPNQTQIDLPDPRIATPSQIESIVQNLENLNASQKSQVKKLLLENRQRFSKKPGEYKEFSYNFQVESLPKVTSTNRPIPFAIRKEVKDELSRMLHDGIIETSISPYINPLAIVPRKDKTPRICQDARKINSLTATDEIKTEPIQKLLQVCHI
jgi:hypothetical protein